jgi:AraC-like DNA-binding protein
MPNAGNHFIFRTYGSPYPTLLFCRHGYVTPVGDETNGKFLLLGQSNTWCRFRTSNDFKIFGLTLYPFTLPIIFNIPAYTITNKVQDGDLISIPAELTKFCRQATASLSSPESINDLLLERLKKRKNYDMQIPSFIMSSFQSKALSLVPEFTKKVFMSQRNFERKFKYYSGFTPKTFSNLTRLISTIESLCKRNKKLSDTALEYDYFDQSHFSNEFKRHTGFQPSIFVKSNDYENIVWKNFVDFFQVLSICPPVLCMTDKH